jgi:hypothetical protein
MTDPTKLHRLLADALDALAEIADQTIDYTSKQTAETTVHRIKSTLNSNT